MLLAAGAFAAEWRLESPKSCGEVTFSRFHSVEYALIEKPDGTVVLQMPDALYGRIPGEPHLPMFVRGLPIPKNCQAEIEFIAAEFVETNTPPIKPISAHVLSETDGIQRADRVDAMRAPMYAEDAFWPLESMQIQYAAQGTQRWARVTIHPLQYNAVRGILRWNKFIEARLVWREVE